MVWHTAGNILDLFIHWSFICNLFIICSSLIHYLGLEVWTFLEIVFVDDGSNDGSAKWLSNYVDKNKSSKNQNNYLFVVYWADF